MWIAEVIPIAKGMRKDTLSYFSVAPLVPGAVVRAPLRNKTVTAVVLSCVRAEERKSDLRTATYELKKISAGPESGAHHSPFFHPAFMEMVNEMATYYATGAGEILAATVPSRILEEFATQNKKKEVIKEIAVTSPQNTTTPAGEKTAIETESAPEKESATEPETLSEVLIFQSEDNDRIGHYRSLAREAFARKQSILFVAPGSRSAVRLANELAKGIGDFAVTVHGDLSPAKERAAIDKILEESHALIIVCTPGYISLPRADIGTIILENERSTGYRALSRPFIDMRRVVESYARARKVRLIRGDNFISTESWHHFETGHYAALEQPRTRAGGTSDTHIIDMREQSNSPSRGLVPVRLARHKELQALVANEALLLIHSAREKGERVFVFAGRKGLAPLTVCGDCGTVVRCTHCSRAMVLHRSPTRTFYLCHHCGERADSEMRCANCQSWKLVPLGAGTDRLRDLIVEAFPGITTFVLDKDKAKTALQAEKIVAEWREAPGSILIGTEFAFSFMDTLDPTGIGIADHSIVANPDGLLSLPDYAAYEKLMSLLIEVRRRTRATMIVQTRLPQDPIFEYGTRGMIKEFHQNELATRKAVHYPPFSTLIRVETTGMRDKIAELMAAIKEEVVALGFECDIFPSFIKKAAGKSALAMMIHVKSQWPHEGLARLLKSLPPHCAVVVDAEGSL